MRILGSATVLAIFAAAVISIIFKCFDLRIEEAGIVLTFVGILATFIVVSNYAQVKSIEDKMESEITHLNEELEKLRRENVETERNLSRMRIDITELKTQIEKGDIADVNIKVDAVLSAIDNFSKSEKNNNNIDIEHFKNIYKKVSERKSSILNNSAKVK